MKMKHLKLFESYIIKPQVGYVYKFGIDILCFLGRNEYPKYPLTCFKFNRHGSNISDFVEFDSVIESSDYIQPLDKTIEKYIVENDLVVETLYSFEKKTGHYSESSLTLINQMQQRLLNNEQIKLIASVKKYNL